jgi:hypothetical protein
LAGEAADEGSARNRHQLGFLQGDSFVLCKRVQMHITKLLKGCVGNWQVKA